MAYSFDKAFNFNFNVPQPESHTLTMNINDALPDLLKHPSVMSLWHQNQALQMSQNKLTDMVASLQQNNMALQGKVHSLSRSSQQQTKRLAP